MMATILGLRLKKNDIRRAQMETQRLFEPYYTRGDYSVNFWPQMKCAESVMEQEIQECNRRIKELEENKEAPCSSKP